MNTTSSTDTTAKESTTTSDSIRSGHPAIGEKSGMEMVIIRGKVRSQFFVFSLI
jgi:hypothetical protein